MRKWVLSHTIRVTGREGEWLKGSNRFNCHNRITNQLRLGHPSGPHMHLSNQRTPRWWNRTGWRPCQVNNTDWSLMLNFLEVPCCFQCFIYLLRSSTPTGPHGGLEGIQRGSVEGSSATCRWSLNWNTVLEELWSHSGTDEHRRLMCSRQQNSMYCKASDSSSAVKPGLMASITKPNLRVYVSGIQDGDRCSLC